MPETNDDITTKIGVYLPFHTFSADGERQKRRNPTMNAEINQMLTNLHTVNLKTDVPYLFLVRSILGNIQDAMKDTVYLPKRNLISRIGLAFDLQNVTKEQAMQFPKDALEFLAPRLLEKGMVLNIVSTTCEKDAGLGDSFYVLIVTYDLLPHIA